MDAKSLLDSMLESVIAQAANIAATRLEPILIDICKREWNSYLRIVEEKMFDDRRVLLGRFNEKIDNFEGLLQDLVENIDGLSNNFDKLNRISDRLSELDPDTVSEMVSDFDDLKRKLSKLDNAVEDLSRFESDTFDDRVDCRVEDMIDRLIPDALSDLLKRATISLPLEGDRA